MWKNPHRLKYLNIPHAYIILMNLLKKSLLCLDLELMYIVTVLKLL